MQPWQCPDVTAYSSFLSNSFRHWTKKPLVEPFSTETLYHAPFVLVSHGVQSDPIFCYANLAAQKLWNMDWRGFTQLPSRFSAEPDAQEDRQRLLFQAETRGYIDSYQGIRITADKKRFRISDCILWNVLDNSGNKIGQAAMFDRWEWL